MARLMQPLLLALMALYPFFVFFGLQFFSLQNMALLMLATFVMRIWLAKRASGVGGSLVLLKSMVIPVALAGVVLSFATVALQNERALLFYPCVVSFAGLLSFSWTLLKPPSMIECFARLLQNSENDFPEEGVRYTRIVTMIWCLFFLANGLLAFVTVVHNDLMLWMVYNGLISYSLMGLLLGGEWIWRKRVLKL